MTNQSISTNGNNDIYLGANGNLVVATGVTAVQQDCEHALKAQLGEMIYNPRGGMPTFYDVWQSQNFIRWNAVARATLANISGVFKVVSLSISVNDGTFSYVAQIQTTYSSALVGISGTIGN
jgi:hypothetical protein